MRSHRRLALPALMLVCAAGTVSAQDTRTVGIAMGYPASFGLHWQVGDKVALRPEITISGSSAESTGSSFTGESDSTAVAVTIGALFYMGKYDKVRTYVSPRFAYGHASADSTTSSLTTSKSESTSKAYAGSGSFGAQFDAHERFSVFGEFGFSFGHTTADNGPGRTGTKGNAWGTRSAAGVIFFF